MLPLSNLNDMLYPMRADIYYSTETQGPLGDMQQEWTFDRTVQCSAIKQRATYNADYAQRIHRDIENNIKTNMRTESPINISSTGEYAAPSDILITNIVDGRGNFVWQEIDGSATTFEVDSIEPLLDEFGFSMGYRSLLMRSPRQGL